MKHTAVQEFALALMRAKAIKSSSTNDFIKAHAEALRLEKKQIIDAWNIRAKIDDVLTFTDNRTAEQYYNETFKSK